MSWATLNALAHESSSRGREDHLYPGMDLDLLEARDDQDGAAKQPMAIQACETCRQRKVKCDENRPRCGVCRRLNSTCEYREAKPTKKDKTLVFILDTLKALELKMDLVYAQKESLMTSVMASHASTSSQLSWQRLTLGSEEGGPSLGSTTNLSLPATPAGQFRFSLMAEDSGPSQLPLPQSPTEVEHRQIEARKLLAWPAIRTFLGDDLVQAAEWVGPDEGGEKWLTRISESTQSPLPCDELVNFNFPGKDGTAHWDPQSYNLTTVGIYSLCRAFFHWFHPVYPILDRLHFYDVTLPRVLSSFFSQEDGTATLVLLVLALGAVAQEGICADPIVDKATGRRTGVRGGTVDRTPGLAFLNEAKKRYGFAISQYDLVAVQCSLLFAVYYSQCSRNLEYWRMTSLSCSFCQNLVRTIGINWKPREHDLIARSYWMCVHLEGGLTTELGLTPSGLSELEGNVPLPLFISNTTQDDPGRDDDLLIQYHFLAQNTLRALLNRIYTSLHLYDNPFQRARTSEVIPELIPKSLIFELARQLQTWREHLPPPLQWSDDNPDDGIEVSSMSVAWQYTVLRDQISPSVQDAKVILTASLRTRYKYAQYLIWRPYLYKMLHWPDFGSDEEIDGCRMALKACSRWPLTYPVFQEHRRLVPHIYEYSHTFFGILVLLHVCRDSPVLRQILESLDAPDELGQSKDYMLCWMLDMQVAHPVARWCWQLLKVIYKDHELLQETERARRRKVEKVEGD